MANITAQERKLAETLRDPVLWGQAYLFNRDGSRRGYWAHQVDDLRCTDRNIIHLDGRTVGKTDCAGHGCPAFCLHHPRRPGARRRAAPGSPGHDHRGDRVPARYQRRPDEQRGPDQIRQAQDPPQAVLPPGVHQRLGALLSARRSLRRRVPVAARGTGLGGRGRLALREGLEGAAPVPEGRRQAAHLLDAQRPAQHHLLPADAIRAVQGVPLALVAQSRLERRSAKPSCWSSTAGGTAPAGSTRSPANTASHPTARSTSSSSTSAARTCSNTRRSSSPTANCATAKPRRRPTTAGDAAEPDAPVRHVLDRRRPRLHQRPHRTRRLPGERRSASAACSSWSCACTWSTWPTRTSPRSSRCWSATIRRRASAWTTAATGWRWCRSCSRWTSTRRWKWKGGSRATTSAA